MKNVSTSEMAASWIRDQLRWGPVRARTLLERGQAQGFNRTALYRAAEQAHVESIPGPPGAHRERLWKLGAPPEPNRPPERQVTVQRASGTQLKARPIVEI